MTKLKPWYQVITPREDLRDGRPLDASEFAVHLDHIREKRAHPDYVQPERFFERTFLTRSLLDLSSQVVRRLSGIKVETSAVFNMATQFGGGKTHSLTALYHLAHGGPAAANWKGVDEILTRAEVREVPKAAVAVFVGTEFDVVDGRGGEGGEPRRKTPWGEIAWQLGGKKSFDAVAKHDADGIAPAGDVIRKMLPDGPALILMDELLNYVNRSRRSGLAGQLYDFVQNLSEEARARDNLVLCVSIPASELEMNPEDERDFQSLKKLLERVGKDIAMSGGDDVTEIIRRRLFEWQGLPEDGRKTVSAFAEWARDHAGELANLSGENASDKFRNAYPFHPTVISVFERKWQSLPRFQRTRGVLRLLALWVSAAYKDGYGKATGEPLIQLGSAPLADPTFCQAAFAQLGEDKLLVPVITDIAGKPDSHAVRLDNEAADDVKKARLHQKIAATIFFESNGGQSHSNAVATVPEIRTALGGPEFNLAEVDTVLEALTSTCFYLVLDRNRYRFGLRPNLNQMLVNSRGNVKPKDIDSRLKQEIEALFKDGGKGLDRKFFPVRSNDVPDRPQLTLVVLGVDHTAGDSATMRLIEEVVRNAGTAGRTFKSGLLFSVSDAADSARQAAQTLLAWEDIDSDEDAKERLDDTGKSQLKRNLDRAGRDLKEALFRGYRHIYLLSKDNALKDFDLGQITSSSIDGGRISDLIVQELTKRDEVTTGVGPNKIVHYWPGGKSDWSTKDVRNAFFAAPALPRLINPDSIRRTIADGVSQGIIGYGRRNAQGSIELIAFKKPLSEMDVELSDDACILKADDAQKLVEPPRLTRISIEPSSPRVKPGEQIVFAATGSSQYGQPMPLPNLRWTAVGGQIEPNGRFVAGPTIGDLQVTAQQDDIEAKVRGSIAESPPPAPGGTTPPPGDGHMKWSGNIPPQKWMTFYSKVLSRFANTPGFNVTVTFDVPLPDGQAKSKRDETQSALKELGLFDQLES